MQIVGIEKKSDEDIISSYFARRELAAWYTKNNPAAMAGRGHDIKAYDMQAEAACYEAEAARRGLKIVERRLPFGHLSPKEATGAMYPDEFDALACLTHCTDEVRYRALVALRPFGRPTWTQPIPAERADVLRQVVAVWDRDHCGYEGSHETLVKLVAAAL